MFILKTYVLFIFKVLTEESFILPTLFGQVSQDREEAAMSLVKIFEMEGTSVDMITAVIENEVKRAGVYNYRLNPSDFTL
jgi:UTP-glucose-1-phosphate uridylyltransferase